MRREPAEAEVLAAEAPSEQRPSQTTWRWSAFRQGLERRRDAEHAFGLVRIAVLTAWLAYSVISEASLRELLRRPAPLLAVVALGVAFWLLNEAAKDPDVSPGRRLAAIVLDQAFICLTLLIVGERGAWLLPVSLLVSTANGLHFGRNYGLFAAALGTAGFAGVLALRPDAWGHAGTLAEAIAAALFVIPAYVSLAGERLLNAGQERRARTGELTRLAMEDALTRLANRAYFKKCIAQAIESAQSGEAEQGFAVLCCDLDNFKLVNETHGHPVGDSVLRHTADALRKCVRGTDVVARIGGDEFAIYLKGIGDAEIAKRIGRNIVAAVRGIDHVENAPVQLACSLGITMVAAPVGAAVNADHVMARADEAMFQAKRAGKNQFYIQWANL